MSLIAKGVYDITYSFLSAVVHVVLRDFTNYYWYTDEAQRPDDVAADGLVPNSADEGFDCLEPLQGDQRAELEEENIPCESFCTSLTVEESTANVCKETGSIEDNNSIEDNSMVQNYEVTIQTEAKSCEDNVNSLKCEEKEATNNIKYDFNEIQRVEDNVMVEESEENLNNSTSPKKENCIWVEIQNCQPNLEESNLNLMSPNITEKELSGNTLENVTDEREAVIDSQTENSHLVSQPEGEPNPPVDDRENIERECSLKYDRETGENSFTCETVSKKHKLESSVESHENISIGDSKVCAPEMPNDGKSDISSECELGIRNFQIHNLIDECSNVGKPEVSNPKKKGPKNKPLKSKISRYVGNTASKNKKLKEPIKQEDTSNMESESNTKPEEIENVLQPLKYDEITNTQSLLNELQVAMESENTGNPSEVKEDHSEIPRVPEASDMGSVCSDDSWDSWLGKFVTIMRSKSPMKNGDVSLPGTSAAKEDVPKGDMCDCINSHCCLMVVDSDDEEYEDLLSAEQLGSVETGSTVHDKTE